MHDAARQAAPRVSTADQKPAAEDDSSNLWQWLAIGVLIGCWLAEATWCIDRGF